jgi:hypothetical protein
MDVLVLITAVVLQVMVDTWEISEVDKVSVLRGTRGQKWLEREGSSAEQDFNNASKQAEVVARLICVESH